MSVQINREIHPEYKGSFIKGFPVLFTAKSLKTGNHFTFKRARDVVETPDGNVKMAFYSVLVGHNNESPDAYAFFGTLFKNNKTGKIWFKHSKSNNCLISEDAPSVKAFGWLAKGTQEGWDLSSVELKQANKCVLCGRTLTDPDSIEYGIGPKCRAKLS